MNKVQRILIREKLWSTFRLFGFAIGINILSAFVVFMIKIATFDNTGLNFIDDWLLKVILPTAFSLILFIVIFLVEWNKLTLGDYSSNHMDYGDFEDFLIDIGNNIKYFRKATKREKQIVLKKIINNVLIKLPLFICNEDIDDNKKIGKEDQNDLLGIHNFIVKNIEILDQTSDVVAIWRRFSNSQLYCDFLDLN